MELVDILQLAIKWNASDISMIAGVPPCMRINGDIIKTDFDVLTPTEVEKIADSLMTETQNLIFTRDKDLDFTYDIHGLSRFRVNVHYQRNTVAISIRVINGKLRTCEELMLPKKTIEKIVAKKKGLVLVTGPTGSGKSTTLAAMVEMINQTRRSHIITIEDPIEFLFDHKKSIIEQREVFADTGSFYTALKYALRQDPDVIMVGEMRDLETISMAITAAETGHLVLSTLHTPSAIGAISRIIDVFPSEKQAQIRMQLGSTLEAVISQHLVPSSTKEGRILALEMLIGTPAIQSLIRKGDTAHMTSLMQTGAMYGMTTLEKSLNDAYKKNLISHDEVTKLQQSYSGNYEEN